MTITAADIGSMLPLIILAGGAIVTMLLVAIRRNHQLAFGATSAVLAASFISLFYRSVELPHAIGEILSMDAYGDFYMGMLLVAAFLVNLFAYIGFQQMESPGPNEEFYLLLMLSTLGACFMAYSTHFISFFIGLETLSVALYTMIGYYRNRNTAIEAGVKYLILAAMSSAFLLFGMALVYAVSGTMSFAGLSQIPAIEGPYYLLITGLGMMTVGIGFKLAVVPFHMWTPDVYQGASSPVTAFIATVSKGGVVAVLLRFFAMNKVYLDSEVILVFAVIAILSMLLGNLLALLQNNVKRILAYSSIAHFGYLLVAFIAGGTFGTQAATFYLVTYFVTILGAFGLITLISKGSTEAEDISNYHGLFWRKPWLAAAFTVFLLSLAGIPLTAGFVGKYFLLTAGVDAQLWVLAFVLVISSVIGLYYYLHIIVTMMKQEEREGASIPVLSFSGSLILVALTVGVVWLGVLPDWLMQIIIGLWG